VTDQTACKPGSVPAGEPAGDDHSSGPPIAERFSRPTRIAGPVKPVLLAEAHDPYSVLLQAGLAMPSLSPGPRWALTPPFHPYPTSFLRNFEGLALRSPGEAGRSALCGAIP